MKHAAFPPREAERLAELYRYEVLDTAPEKALDDLVHLAAYICQAPISVISLVDADRQWFKSKIGLSGAQTSRVIAFCAHTILSDELLVVSDAQADERFADNPLVTGDPHIRFYCGAPLTTPAGLHIGTLGVIDRVPRELSQEQLEAMRVLSRQVMDHLNLDRRHKELLTAVGERLKVEQALVASQTKFQQLSDSTTAGIYIYSGERFLYANPAATTITGYSLEELQSLTLWDLVHPDFHETLKARVKAVEAGDRDPALLEFSIIAKDGTVRWLDFTAASIEFEGQPARIGTAIDRTQRKQAESLNEVQRRILEMLAQNKPLTETMQLLLRSIEALSDGGICTILFVDPTTNTLRHGMVSTMPEAFYALVDGAPVGPQVGSCGTAAYRKTIVIVTDIATDPLWQPWTEARKLILSNGFKACTSVPILDSRGDVLGTYAIYYRSTRGPTSFESQLLQVSSYLLGIALERRRNEEALRVTEERMRAIVDNSPLMIFLKDRAGRYLLTNREFDRRFNLPSGYPIGKTDSDLFHAEQALALQTHDQEVLRIREPIRFEEAVRLSEGERIGLVVKFPLRDTGDDIYGVGGIVTDITERKEAEAALADRVRQQAVVAQLGQQALAGMELKQLFNQAVRMVGVTLNVEYCKLLECLPNGHRFKLVAGIGWKKGLVGRATVSGGRDSQAGVTLLHSEPIIVEDFLTEQRFSGPPLLRDHDIRSGISVVVGSLDQPFGVLGAHTRSRRAFSRDDTHFIQAVANVLAEAIQRKRAEEKAKEGYRRLQRLSREVQLAGERERRHLSRELHDEFGQLLSALRLSVGRIGEELATRPGRKGVAFMKQVKVATKAVERLLDSVRQMVQGLRPAVLDELGLVAALQSMVDDIQQVSGLNCQLWAEPKNIDAVIGQEMVGTLYRIAQELITNVVRHAKATRVSLILRYADGQIMLTVQDNGQGGNLHTPKKGYGLRGIQERAELFGGQVEIRSERQTGTTVTVTIPIDLRQGSPGSHDSPKLLVAAAKPNERRRGKKV